jgi:predicted SAM-dependent methyltransferase
MRHVLKKIPFVSNLVWLVRGLFGVTPKKLSHRYHLKRRDEIIQRYLTRNSERLLHIGCQDHVIASWLNVDIAPRTEEVMYMDATERFPFPDATFDCIFSEHMIEHIALEKGRFMVSECLRVLKPGGKIRVTTPNLKFLIELYREEKLPVQKEYIEFSKRYFHDTNFPLTDTIVINNFFRDWGHQFIYDKKTLQSLFSTCGFCEVTFPELHQSDDLRLQNLERHGLEITEEFNRLESIVVEARKP